MKVSTLSLVGAALIGLSQAAVADTKIGFVNSDRVMREGLQYLCRSIDVLVDALGRESMPLFLGGGFLMNSRFLLSELEKYFAQHHPQLTLEEMSQPAEWGAVVLAASLIDHVLPESRMTAACTSDRPTRTP